MFLCVKRRGSVQEWRPRCAQRPFYRRPTDTRPSWSANDGFGQSSQRKNPVEQIYWRPGFYSEGVSPLSRYGSMVIQSQKQTPDARFPKSQTRLDPSAVTIGSLRVPVLWKYDPGWEIEKRFGMGIWSSMGDFTRQPGTRNCPLHLPMPRSSQKIFIPAV